MGFYEHTTEFQWFSGGFGGRFAGFQGVSVEFRGVPGNLRGGVPECFRESQFDGVSGTYQRVLAGFKVFLERSNGFQFQVCFKRIHGASRTVQGYSKGFQGRFMGFQGSSRVFQRISWGFKSVTEVLP